MGDETMNPQQQQEHPADVGPTAEGNEDAAPKVDAGDSGATVGTPGSTEADTSALQERMDKIGEQGYEGYNPDEADNETYTVKGVIAAAAEGDEQQGGEEPVTNPEA